MRRRLPQRIIAVQRNVVDIHGIVGKHAGRERVQVVAVAHLVAGAVARPELGGRKRGVKRRVKKFV